MRHVWFLGSGGSQGRWLCLPSTASPSQSRQWQDYRRPCGLCVGFLPSVDSQSGLRPPVSRTLATPLWVSGCAGDFRFRWFNLASSVHLPMVTTVVVFDAVVGRSPQPWRNRAVGLLLFDAGLCGLLGGFMLAFSSLVFFFCLFDSVLCVHMFPFARVFLFCLVFALFPLLVLSTCVCGFAFSLSSASVVMLVLSLFLSLFLIVPFAFLFWSVPICCIAFLCFVMWFVLFCLSFLCIFVCEVVMYKCLD